MLLLRHQVHASSLYTSKRTALNDPTAPRKTYGQAQMNAVYGVKNKASLDPFTSMPTYSQKFVRQERALPDWSGRPVCRELFPRELLETVDGSGGGGAGGVGGGPHKKRRLELSRVSALPNAEEAFGMPSLVGDDGEGGGGDVANGQTLLDKLEALRDEEGDEAEGDAEEAAEEDDEDEIYDDEDAGDYDAEQFFDNGEEFGDEYGDGDDGGEGTY